MKSQAIPIQSADIGHAGPAVRPLRRDDVPALLRLEHRQWSTQQAATATEIESRLSRWPDLCLGSFDPVDGELRASLFMRPFDPATLPTLASWSEAVQAPPSRARSRSLFGISLTSVDADAADALFRHFWPLALRAGWRHIYLGSPIPGFAAARQSEPALTADAYARRERRGLPADAQLRYYHRRGFMELIAVKPNYFPHPPSLDHGALLRGRIPLGNWGALWRVMPAGVVRGLTNALSRRINA